MFNDGEVQRLKKRNYRRMRELIRISFSLGVNLTSPSFFKDSLKIINIIFFTSSLLSLYGHWSYVIRYFGSIPKIAESIATAFQSIISVNKMIYYLFFQRKFYVLLNKTQTHEYLRKIDIFHKDFPINKKLKMDIDKIMEANWKNIRGQLIFYIVCCICILSNYYISSIFVNLYHYLIKTPNYQHVLPYPSVYPIWDGKGMSFPYYEMELFLSSCAVYISAFCAVSFDGVFIILAVHGVGLIKVLNTMVENSTSPEVPKERRVEYLRYCIFQYQRVYDYTRTVNNLYKHISLPQFIITMVVWGLVLFQLSFGLAYGKTTFVRMIMYIAAAGYQVVLYCYNGQRLTSESEKIPMAFYSCEWYNESEEFKKLVRMMILRTSRTFHVDISWFTTMSLPTLMVMVKTSSSYFLLLQNLNE